MFRPLLLATAIAGSLLTSALGLATSAHPEETIPQQLYAHFTDGADSLLTSALGLATSAHPEETVPQQIHAHFIDGAGAAHDLIYNGRIFGDKATCEEFRTSNGAGDETWPLAVQQLRALVENLGGNPAEITFTCEPREGAVGPNDGSDTK